MAVYTPIYQVRTDYVMIKFLQPIKVSSILNSGFKLYDATSATPALSEISNPFQSINTIRDYSSVSRVLYLYWNDNVPLEGDHDYIIRITGVKDFSGTTLDPMDLTFAMTQEAATPSTGDVQIPTREPVEVEDYSVKVISQFVNTIPDPSVGGTNVLRVTGIKPDMSMSYFLEPGYNEGRIEITFSHAVAANYLTREYFRLQRKSIGRGMSRWEDVPVVVAGNSSLKIVFIYLPSDDATPVYGEPDRIYWEDGYKYRLRLSGNIGAEDGAL